MEDIDELITKTQPTLKNFWRKAWWSKVIVFGVAILFWPLLLLGLSLVIFQKFEKPYLRWGLIILIWLITAPMTIGWSQGWYSVLTGSEKTQPQTETSEQTTKASPSSSASVIPSPTSTPKLELSEDPQKYIDYSQKLSTILGENGKLATDIGNLVGKWPDLTGQELVKLAALTVAAESSHEDLESITPPIELLSIHKKYVDGYKIYGEAMPILRDGLDADDPALISRATSKVKESGRLLEEANKKLDAFSKSLGN